MMMTMKKYLILPALLFLACTVLGDALVTVSGTSAAPKLNGTFAGECWEKAAGFQLLPNMPGGIQVENGNIRLASDDKFLYIGGRLDQSYLNPVANRLELVRPHAKGDGDAAIYRDDVIEIFWQVPGESDYYHFSFNQAGHRIFGKARGYGINSPLDPKQIRVATHLGETFWSFELAIPLGLAGGGKDTVKFNLCRNNNPKEELSAWSPTGSNFHQADKFGTLAFDRTAPAVQPTRTRFSAGGIDFSVRFASGAFRFAGASGTGALAKSDSWRSTILRAAPDAATGTIQISVYNAETDRLLWRTPLITVNSSESGIQVSLQLPGAGKLYLDGQEIESNVRKIERKLILTGNLHALALEVEGESGTFSGYLDVGGLQIPAAQFLESASAKGNWKSAGYDDTKWREADTSALVTGRRYYRFSIVRNHALFAPQRPNRELYVNNRASQQWTLRIGSPFEHPAANYRMNIAMPEAVTVPRYDFEQREYNRFKHEFKDSPVAGNQRQLTFDFREPMAPLPYNWGFYVVNFILTPGFAEIPDKPLPVKVWQSGRGFTEFPQEYKLIVLPELKSGTPEKIVINLYDVERDNCFTVDEMKFTIDTFAASGINFCGVNAGKIGNDQIISDYAHQLGMKTVFCFFGPYSTWFNRHLRLHPEQKRVNPVHPAPGWLPGVCPEYFLTDPEIKRMMQDAFARNDVFIDDVERGINDVCLCDRCRQRFAKRFKLPSVPTAEAIYKEHQKQLITYNQENNLRMVEYELQLAKEVNPAIRSAVYSGYDSSDAPRIYGIDWKLYRGKLDYPSAGYELNTAFINKTRQALGGQPIICGYILDTAQYERPLASQNIKGMLFHQLRNSGFGGVLIWSWRDLDGRGWQAINEFARGTAAFEDYLDEQKAIPFKVTGWDDESLSAYRNGDSVAVMAVNLSSAARKLTAKLPAGMPSASMNDFYQDTTVEVRDTFSVNVPPGGAVLLNFKPLKEKNR